MPRGLLGILIFLLVSVSVARAQGDVVLLRIGDTQVCKSEYEYYFNRSNCKTQQEFLENFISYKTKALYAKDLGLDTFPDFKNQRRYYLQSLVELADRKNSVGWKSHGEEWIELWHITFPLGQHATKDTERNAKFYMDSISSVLEKMPDGGEKLGKTCWIPRKYLLSEWDKEVRKLAKGKISKPFYSSIGMHIISWKDKKTCEELVGKDADSINALVYDHRVKEIEDALLVMALSMKQTLSCSEKELEEFFTEHRKDYQWDYPHYRGAVFHCKNKKVAKAIKKYLKRYDCHLWEEALNASHPFLSDSYEMEYGLFPIGKNKYVDKLVFKCGSFEQLSDYPYTFVMGKKLKVPDSYQDVRDKVEKDYLNYQESRENDVIKHKYKVEINEEVLKTVNNSGNK